MVEILVVEDSATQAELLQQILTSEGYSVTVAKNGSEGLEKIRSGKPALVISDIVMPVMDGYKMCREIKRDKELKGIPVVLLTQLSDTWDVITGLDAGADNYVTKPYDKKFLLSWVKSLLATPVHAMNEGQQEGIDVTYAGKRHVIYSGRIQIVNFLLSTYENAVQQNRELMMMQSKLRTVNKQLEEKLHELQASEERFCSLVQLIPDIVYRIDRNGRFTFVNNAIRRLGYTPEELIGRHFSEIVLPMDVESVSREKVLPRYNGKVTSGKEAPKLFDERRSGERMTKNLEVRLVSKCYKGMKPGLIETVGKEMIITEVNSAGMYEIVPDSKKKEFRGSMGIIKDASREMTFIGTVGAIRDITDRKLAEEALYESEERFRMLVQTAGTMIVYLSTNYQILEWNHEAEYIFGKGREEVLGKDYLELFTPEGIKDMVAVKLKKALHGELVRDFETSVKTRGTEHILLWNFTRLLNSRGNPVGIIAVGQDITERKRMEEEKLKANSDAEAAKTATDTIEGMMDAVVITDLEGRLTQFNKGFAESFGWNKEILGGFLTQYVAEWDVQKVREGIKECVEKCYLKNFEYHVMTKDKRVVPVMVNMTLLRDSGNSPVKIIAVQRDITERKRYESALQERNSELSVLYEVSSVIAGTMNMDELFQKLLHTITRLELFNVERRGAIFLVEDGRMRLVSYIGYPEGFTDLHCNMKVGDCLCGLAAKTGEMILSKSAEASNHHTISYHGIHSHTHTSIPLKVKEKVLGILSLCLPTHADIDERKKKMFLSIGEQIGIAIDNLRLYEETKALSLHDPLTGLANRRFMDIVLERNIARVSRFEEPLSTIIMDIDHFKRYNDTYGHTAADKVLVKIAKILSKEVREIDLAIRYGGEEFLILLPDTDLASAYHIAERIRSTVETNTDVTISLGVSSYRKGTEDKETLINHADKALYQAKQKGRNRVEIHDSEAKFPDR